MSSQILYGDAVFLSDFSGVYYSTHIMPQYAGVAYYAGKLCRNPIASPSTNQLIVHGGDRIQQEVALSAIQKEAALSTIQIDTGNMTAVTKNEIHSYVKVHCH